MARLVWVVAVLACSVIRAEETDWTAAVVKACKESATMKRAQLDSRLTYLKKLKGKGTYKNVAEKDRAITGVQAQLAYPDGDLIEFNELPTEKLEVGQIGYTDNKELIVVQVIDQKSALVEAFRFRPTGAVGQVANRYYKEAKLLFLEADTSKWTDGEKVSFRDPIAITGTKQYRTAAGSKTVLHAHALDGDVLIAVRGRVTYGDKKKEMP